MKWSRSTAQALKRQLTNETCKIIDFLAQNPDRKFTTDELVDALSLKSHAELRSRLGKTTIAAKGIGVPQDELHSWFVLWQKKPEWLYWLDSKRSNWWLPNSKLTELDILSNTIREIASLQPLYSSENTEAMQKRGILIRQTLPTQLMKFLNRFSSRLGNFGSDTDIEGRDGIGRKTPAPWVRIFSKELSPSATTGFYLVIHFSVDGTRCFVTVGCASTRWDSEKGDLVKSSDEEIEKKVNWARATIEKVKVSASAFNDTIEIGSNLKLPKSFEKATAFCQTHAVDSLTDNEFLQSIDSAMDILRPLYKSYFELEDLSSAEMHEIEIESVVNPRKKNVQSRQGYGLSAKERRAVEIRAMEVTQEYLTSLGYEVLDMSSTQSYDFRAQKGDEVLKVEVKGTTSTKADAILMTANEVRLHLDKSERTAIAIVSGINFVHRGDNAICEGGKLEYREPSAIDDWGIEPTAYVVRRKK